MTSNQKIKCFANVAPKGESTKNVVDRLNAFISSENINAKAVSGVERGILLMYEEQ